MGVSENDVYPHNFQEHDEKSLGICIVCPSQFSDKLTREKKQKTMTWPSPLERRDSPRASSH